MFYNTKIMLFRQMETARSLLFGISVRNKTTYKLVLNNENL